VRTGFYKRRRGILEHIDGGLIDLLESGIHDYLCLKANLVLGNGYSIPAGVCFTSAPALYARCKGRVSQRTIQRILARLKAIGWIKTWALPGKRGNYAVLICRASVHDLAGNEYRVNGAKTMDWRHPEYEPVGEPSVSCPLPVGELAGIREVRVEKTEKRIKKNLAAKPAPPADPRYQPFYDFAYQAFHTKHGQRPTWDDKDGANLKRLLRLQPQLTLEEFQRRFGNYLQSTEPFTRSHGDSLAYFVAAFDRFLDGPVLERAFAGGNNGNESFDERRKRESLEAICDVGGSFEVLDAGVVGTLPQPSRNPASHRNLQAGSPRLISN
jgi:hypothetical protein